VWSLDSKGQRVIDLTEIMDDRAPVKQTLIFRKK
jgi:hypothetical protein